MNTRTEDRLVSEVNGADVLEIPLQRKLFGNPRGGGVARFPALFPDDSPQHRLGREGTQFFLVWRYSRARASKAAVCSSRHDSSSASEADPDLGFMARLLALCSLPRTNPGQRYRYVRSVLKLRQHVQDHRTWADDDPQEHPRGGQPGRG